MNYFDKKRILTNSFGSGYCCFFTSKELNIIKKGVYRPENTAEQDFATSRLAFAYKQKAVKKLLKGLSTKSNEYSVEKRKHESEDDSEVGESEERKNKRLTVH